LRLRGPNRDKSADYETDAIQARERIRNEDETVRDVFSRILIDHNDISELSNRAVVVTADDPSTDKDECEIRLPAPPTRQNRVYVARDSIHHNQVEDQGYGVNANSGGFPLIEGNTFVWNRHAIAGTNSTEEAGLFEPRSLGDGNVQF